ncbi:MAG: hypothetical protein Tsb0015_01010 [Simkaniaceae bacterium]
MVYGAEKFMIGFFIFAISTGLPEISTAIVASLKKVPDLSVGDLMGASLLNMTLILGIVLLLAKKIDPGRHLKKKIYQTISLILLILIGIAFSPKENVFTGILLITVYLGSVFLFHAGIPKKTASREIEETEEKMEKVEEKAKLPPKIDVLLRLAGSLAFLIFSSWVMVHAASRLASLLHIDLTVIGSIFIAIGTTLPELSLEVHAVKKKEYDLALGDIFGSSLLNVSFVLGILTLFNPGLSLSFSRYILSFFLAASVWIIQKLLRKKPLQRWDAYFLLGIFVLYMVYIILFYKSGMFAH